MVDDDVLEQMKQKGSVQFTTQMLRHLHRQQVLRQLNIGKWSKKDNEIIKINDFIQSLPLLDSSKNTPINEQQHQNFEEVSNQNFSSQKINVVEDSSPKSAELSSSDKVVLGSESNNIKNYSEENSSVNNDKLRTEQQNPNNIADHTVKANDLIENTESEVNGANVSIDSQAKQLTDENNDSDALKTTSNQEVSVSELQEAQKPNNEVCKFDFYWFVYKNTLIVYEQGFEANTTDQQNTLWQNILQALKLNFKSNQEHHLLSFPIYDDISTHTLSNAQAFLCGWCGQTLVNNDSSIKQLCIIKSDINHNEIWTELLLKSLTSMDTQVMAKAVDLQKMLSDYSHKKEFWQYINQT